MTRQTKAEWAERVRRWRACGATAREFAARERVNERTLRWWGWRLQREGSAPPAFIEVTRPAVDGDSKIEIVVRDGVRIRVSGAFDAELLRRVVAALEAR